jgi:transcriptional regulator with XRE-family HTH domain
MNESAKSQIGERLRLFRETKKMSQVQMAAALDATTRGLQNNELNISLPNSKMLIGLYALGMNVNWLLSGEGPMLLADLQPASDVNTAGAADLHAYGECLEILELALNKFNRKLDPEKKRAAVDSLYRAWLRDKQIDSQLLNMITQLAA